MSTTESTTEFKMPDSPAGGHASIDMYLWRETNFQAAFREVNGRDMVCLNVGMLRLVVTREQWRAISDAVESVLPQAVVS